MRGDTATVEAIRDTVTRSTVSLVLSDGRRVGCARKRINGLGIAEGMTLLPAMVQELQEAEAETAYAAAMRRLARTEQTETEVRQYLAGRGFGRDGVEQVVERLRRERAIDDRRAAESHVALRGRSATKSQRLVRRELAARGVGDDIAAPLTEELDDDANALEAAMQRGRRVRVETFAEFERTVVSFLMRRGFSYGTAQRAVRGAYEELHGDERQD